MSIDPKLRDLNIDLPACPATLVQLSLMMSDEGSSIDDMAGLIETDMALASAVVRTVNSALFGLLKRVETVHEAVRYLGMAQVAGLTYEIGLRGAFPPNPLLQALWDRAGIRGLAMGRIARQLDVDQWQAHTMGLFAEAGRAVLMAHDQPRYAALSGDDLSEAGLTAMELQAFGLSHTAFGAALCKAWGLAREVADAVRGRSQTFEQWQHERDEVRRILAIGAAVDALVLGPAPNPETFWADMSPKASSLGLHDEPFKLATTRVVERLNLPE
jgi:HD-like signal output (HDOD) protein